MLRRMFVLLAFALIAAPASAGDLTAYVGGVKPGKLNADNVKTALDSSPIFGFRLQTNFIPAIGIEHTLAFSSDYLFPRDLPAITSAKGFVYNSNLVVSIPAGHAVPYVTAGFGFIRQYGSPDLPVGTKFATNYGGGLKFPKLFGPLGLRFDARGYTALRVFSKSLNMLEVSGGVMLSF